MRVEPQILIGIRQRRSSARAAHGEHTANFLFSKPALTIAFVVCFAAMPLVVPSLQRFVSLKGQGYREMLPAFHELISFKARNTPGSTIGISNSGSAETEPISVSSSSAQLIDDPNHTLERFYTALAKTEMKERGSITRITHYGDSPITNDGITGTTRRLLQERFGDAGHGFILVDRPWAWYGHQAINFTSSGGWGEDSLMNPMTKDGCFGLGGVTFHAGAGHSARFAPASDGDTGRNFSRMEAYYLQQPNGGQFSVEVDGSNAQTVSTASDQTTSGFYEIKSTVGRGNSFEVKTLSGNVRMFGAVLENDGPGVVYDSLGVNGAFAGLLARVMNEQHWAEQLRHRNPDLVVLNYGTNESEYASDDQLARYDKELRQVVTRVRTALPGVSILIVSPMDRGRHAPGGRIITLESIPKIVEMQHRVARETGCAFLNMFEAMGGEGTMARWHESRKHLVGGDLTHPNAEGAETVGAILYDALVSGYSEYQARASIQTATVALKK